MLHAANVLQATEIHTWGCDAATIRWLPPEGGATRLTVAHFKDGGPTYDDALSRLSDIPGPLLLMLPTDLAAALRRELDKCNGLRVGWEAVADGTLLVVLHRDTADKCPVGRTCAPPHRAPHVYDDPPPGGTPARRGMTLSQPSTTTGSPLTTRGKRSGRKTLGRDYRRRVRARLLVLRDPLRQRWDDLWLRRLDPWSPASHLPHTCHVCGECDTVSSAAPTGANRCAQCSQVAACP